MSGWKLVAALLAVAVGLSAPVQAAPREVRLLNWSDYLSPDIPARFEAETGMRLVVEEMDDYDEMLNRLRGGKRNIDLMVLSAYHLRSLIAAGNLEKIQPSKLPGFLNLEEQWRSPEYDPQNLYSIPWHWGTTAFVVDTAQVEGQTANLALLLDPPPALAGKVGLLDEGEEVVGLALRHLGRKRCSEAPDDIAEVSRLLERLLPRAVVYDNADVTDKLATSGLAVQMAWNGDALRARQRNANLRYVYPREGVTVWSDVLVVPKGAPNQDGARAFMSFMLRPDIAALQTSHTLFATAVMGGEEKLPPELRSAPEIIVPPTAKLDFLSSCSAQTNERYRALWASLKKKSRKK